VSEDYLVWSSINNAWWRANRSGYSRTLDEAGRYTRKEAIAICALSRDGWNGLMPPTEVPVLEADAIECVKLFGVAMSGPSLLKQS
jgi:hypothetical protein